MSIISELRAKIKRLEKENERLKKELLEISWQSRHNRFILSNNRKRLGL